MRPSADESTLRQMVNEYCEMPGLCVTARQASVLWQITTERAALLLDSLVELRFLIRTSHGAYARRFVGEGAPVPTFLFEPRPQVTAISPDAANRLSGR